MGSASATEMAFEIAFKRARRRTSNYFPFCRERLNQKGHHKAHLLISPGKGSCEMPLSSNRLQKIVRKWNNENLGNMEDIHKLGLVQNCFYIVPNGITTARDHSDGGVLQKFKFIVQRTGRCMLSHKGQIDADRHIRDSLHSLLFCTRGSSFAARHGSVAHQLRQNFSGASASLA